MKDTLSKEELAELTDDYFTVISNQGKLTTMGSIILFATVTVPQYIQFLFSKGYAKGYADAKKEKIQNILKSN